MLRKWKGLVFVLPSMIGVFLFYMLPSIVSFFYCFTIGMTKKHFVGLDNFKMLFQNEAFKTALFNTIMIIGIALPILCMGALVSALLLEKKLNKYNFFQGLLMIPMALPAASITLLWKDLFNQKGIVNALIDLKIDWLRSEYAPFIVIGIIIWKNIGYDILIFLSTLVTIPKEYEEAASLDGANFLQICLYIKVPYLVPIIFFIIAISLFNCFKIFRDIYLLQGEYPYSKLYMLQHFMNNNFMKLNYELLSTAAFVLYIIIFVFIYIMTKWQQHYIDENF